MKTGRMRACAGLLTLFVVIAPHSSALGCTLGAWLGGSAGDAVAGGPGSPVEIPRFAGQCAMRASDGVVQDNSPASESRMITRFYFFPSGTGSATIYRTFSSEPDPTESSGGTSVYTVSYDGAFGQIVVADTVGGGSTALAVNSDRWNAIEIDWQSGNSIDVWVNSDATSAPPSASITSGVATTGLVDSARLGAQSPISGSVTFSFDDYEARRTTAIGLLLAGDANNDAAVSITDAVAIREEILGNQLNSGIPDCNADGLVSIRDSVCVMAAVLNAKGLAAVRMLAKGFDLIFQDSFEG